MVPSYPDGTSSNTVPRGVDPIERNTFRMPVLPLRRSARLFGALAATLLVTAGLSTAMAATASAHTPLVSVTCDALTVSAASYNGNAENSVTVEIDGETVENATSFDDRFSKTYDFENRAAAHDYVVSIHTSDDPDGEKGYSVVEKGSSTPCVPEIPAAPVVSAGATQCTVPGGAAGTIVATVDGVEGRTYSASVSATGSSAVIATLDVTGDTVTFDSLPTGASYVVTVTDKNADVQASTQPIALAPCPDVPPTVTASSIVTTCTEEGDSIGTITAVVEGDSEHGFTVELTDASGAPVDSALLDAPSTVTFEGLASGTVYTVVVIDSTTGTTVSSEAVTVQKCLKTVELVPPTPTTPATPTAPVTPELPSTPASSSLAETGFDAAPLAIGAGVLLALGGLVVGLRRRVAR
jgi:hypothetical protein